MPMLAAHLLFVSQRHVDIEAIPPPTPSAAPSTRSSSAKHLALLRQLSVPTCLYRANADDARGHERRGAGEGKGEPELAGISWKQKQK